LETPDRTPRWPTAAALAFLLLAPAVLLAPVLFGSRAYLPFDLGRFPPRALSLSADERAALEDPATPPNFDVTELPVLVVPELQLARQELAAGRFPHWNPEARFGAPLFANGLAAMAYPANAALLLGLDPVRGLGFGAWLGFATAGLLGFWLLRRLGIEPAPALFGALAFGLGGTLTANGHFYMRANALVWLPGILLACLAMAERRGRQRALPAVGLGLCTAATLLAGFPPYAVASLLVAGLWSLPLLWSTARRDGAPAAGRLAGWLLGGIVLGAALAAVQVVPMFAFFPESNREVAPSLAVTVSQAFDPMGLLGYLAPTAFGEPGGEPSYPQSALAYLLWSRRALDSGRLQFPHDYNFTEYTVFAGSLTLLLALLGAIAGRQRGTRLAAVGVVSMFVLAAAPPWLGPLLRLPVVASVPPMRYVGPVALLVALLAASGLQTLLEGRARRRAILCGLLGLALATAALVLASISPLRDSAAVVDRLAARYEVPAEVVLRVIPPSSITAAADRLDRALYLAAISLALAGGYCLAALRLGRSPRLRPLLFGLALVGTLAELSSFAAPLNSGRVPVAGTDDTPIHRFLRERDRALAEDGGITVARAAAKIRDPLDLPPGTLFPLRIRDLNSYAFVDSWSHRPFRELYGDDLMIRGYWPRALPDDDRLQRPFFDLVGLRYLLSTDALRHAGAAVGPALVGADGRTFRIYERPGALPRAFVVHARRILADDEAVVAALLEEDLRPRAAVLLTPAEAARIADRPPEPSGGARTVRFATDLPDEIVLEVGAGPAGDLLLADTALSGWTATVDGRPAPIARGDLFMRTVPVPAGACRVEFRYRTPGLHAGLILSACALLAALALLWFGRGRRAAHPVPEPAAADDPRAPASRPDADRSDPDADSETDDLI
jgi:hypothetical protein